jgi:hypothetical protein
VTPLFPPLRPVDLSAESPLANYLRATAAVCPFIEPGARATSLYNCDVRPDCQSADDIHPRLFEQLVPVIERFRDDRRDLPDRQQRLLICHTAIIHVPANLDADTARLLTWPNWLAWALKQLYTPKEIVFGFVRKNAAEKSAGGMPIPNAPFHAVIIRSRVVGSDGRFFKGNRPMLQAMMQADDDGRDAHAIVPGIKPNLRDPQAMRDAGYFQRVRQWGQGILPRQ